MNKSNPCSEYANLFFILGKATWEHPPCVIHTYPKMKKVFKHNFQEHIVLNPRRGFVVPEAENAPKMTKERSNWPWCTPCSPTKMF